MKSSSISTFPMFRTRHWHTGLRRWRGRRRHLRPGVPVRDACCKRRSTVVDAHLVHSGLALQVLRTQKVAKYLPGVDLAVLVAPGGPYAANVARASWTYIPNRPVMAGSASKELSPKRSPKWTDFTRCCPSA